MARDARRAGPLPDPAAIRRLRPLLLRWYRRHHRDLPWRKTSDPYAIWVSETMLQQTTVAAVIPYYERFMKRLPTVGSLARANEETVLGLWSGLGYYRRARSLRAGAIAVMERFGGSLPEDPEALEQLPGVGRYTAGAVSSLAFGREAPVVDGNVRRVLSRLFARSGSGAAEVAALWTIAGILVKGKAPGDLNQAVMELGARVCAPRAPRCASCPVRAHCRARAAGRPSDYPSRAPRKVVRAARAAVALIVQRGSVLLERTGAQSPLRGAWDLPARVLSRGDDAASSIATALRDAHDLDVVAAESIGVTHHAIMDARWRLEIVRCDLRRFPPRSRDLRLVRLADAAGTAVSGATTKVLRSLP